MTMSLREALGAIDAAIAKSESMGLRLCIAVVDDHGELVAVERMDGARAFACDVARGKAMASALWKMSGADMGHRAGSSVGELVNRLYGGRLVYGQGGLPLVRDDEVAGAVGVSGARPEQDEEAAQAAVAAFGASAASG